MTATATEPQVGADKATATQQLLEHFIELPPSLVGPGNEPQYAALLDGFVKAAAATWEPCYDPACLRDVHEAFISLVQAIGDMSDFNQHPEGWLNAHGLPATDAVADAKYHDLESDVQHWTQRLVEAVR